MIFDFVGSAFTWSIWVCWLVGKLADAALVASVGSLGLEDCSNPFSLMLL